MKLSNAITYLATGGCVLFALGAPEGLGQLGLKTMANTANSVKKAITGTKASDLAALKAAIIGNESGGNPSAVNPHSGALGLGQVMPFNVASWSKQALGYSITPSEFLASADLQNKILDHKFAEYLSYAERKFPGDRKSQVMCVAATWYSGQCGLATSTAPQPYNGHEYPSINAYALMAYEKYKKLGGQG